MGLPVLKLEESWANQDTWSPCVIVRTVKGCFLRHLMVTRCCVEGRAASQTDSLMRCLLFTPWEIEDPKFYRILEKTTEWSFLLPPLFCDVTWREIEWPAQGHAASWDGAGTGGLHALVPPCLSHPADPSASARPHPYLITGRSKIPAVLLSRCRNLSFPESLPEVSIVFIFVNEALSVLLRSIHSAIERTPPRLLKEIILVDDNSSNEELKEKLTEYVDKVNGQKPGFIKVVRHSKQEGLIRSRVSGWRVATAPVVALFDAHVEFNVGWAEPVLTRIKENRKRIISPSFDNIKYDNFEIEEYPLAAQGFDWELWCRYLNPPKAWWKLENSTAPIRSPALIGCFIVDRQYFQEIGLLDEGMEVYGGENVELGIRVSKGSHPEGLAQLPER
uniref:Glycosyltransferase 2-like domain-containing protein n=1 Tax=Ursus americanus TaxID=9643 RepID=A0A452RS01_URSAM